MAEKPSVLFVCLGNICRSPLAEAALRHEAGQIGLDIEVDSAGTGHWHVGEPPDRRAQAVARRHGIDISGYRARQVSPLDFLRFSHVLALDEENLHVLQVLRPDEATSELRLLLDYVEGREGQPVADPYYGSVAGFDTTWGDVVSGARALARQLAAGR